MRGFCDPLDDYYNEWDDDDDFNDYDDEFDCDGNPIYLDESLDDDDDYLDY